MDKKDINKSDVDAYLCELVDVSRKHGLSICHEDYYGAFLVERFSEDSAQWLMAAFDMTSKTVNK